MYHSFLEQIKMLCFHFFVARLMATTTIEPDSDLEQMRAWIERFKEDEEEEVRLRSLVLTGGGILGHVVPALVVYLSWGKNCYGPTVFSSTRCCDDRTKNWRTNEVKAFVNGVNIFDDSRIYQCLSVFHFVLVVMAM